MPAAYRIRQFLSALFAYISPAERLLVVEQLSHGELLLFDRMATFDQRHSLDVYHMLVAAGHHDPVLLRAALLHDCGKVDDDGRPIPLVYYGLFVILRKLAPQLYEKAAANGRGLLRPFAIHAVHDRRAALLAEAVGSERALITLLEDYSSQRPTAQTLALRWADEQN